MAPCAYPEISAQANSFILHQEKRGEDEVKSVEKNKNNQDADKKQGG
jgi:hypothetical protein